MPHGCSACPRFPVDDLALASPVPDYSDQALADMSIAEERSRSLIWAGCLMVELAHDRNVALETRRKAVEIARHLPTFEEIAISLPGDVLTVDRLASWTSAYEFGPLRYSTRLDWPDG